MNFRGFVFAFTTFSGSWILRWTVDPSRAPYQSSERKLPESSGEEAPHRVRRLLLHGGGDVGVGIEGKPGREMAQHSGEGFYVHAVLQGQNRECVPLWHNKDKSENPCVATGWRFVLILFPLKTALKWGLREGVKNQGCT